MNRARLPAMPTPVAEAFGAYSPALRSKLLEARRLIFATAASLEGVGALTETLKWGEPAYLTAISGSGSAIRLGRERGEVERGAVYFNCRTTLERRILRLNREGFR